MKIQGADFLKARKLDRELESVIENIFGKKYIVNIEERINAEEVLKQKKKQNKYNKSNRKCNERSDGSTKNGSRKTSTK